MGWEEQEVSEKVEIPLTLSLSLYLVPVAITNNSKPVSHREPRITFVGCVTWF